MLSAAARRHRAVVRAVPAADPGSIPGRGRIDGRRGARADTIGKRPCAVDRARHSAGPVRACDRGADGQDPVGAVDIRRSGPVATAAGARSVSVDAAGATARHRGGRAAGRGRERADRRRQGGVLPGTELRRQRGLAGRGDRRFAHGADPFWSVGAQLAETLFDAASARPSQAHRPPTTPPWRTTGRPC